MNEDGAMTVIVRDYDPESDAPLIYASWRNALWFGDERERARPQHQSARFYSEQTRRIRNILRGTDTAVRIACLKSDRYTIIGYSVLRGTTLEFVYVKEDYRGRKIATMLANGAKDFAAPETALGQIIARKKNLPIQENPNVRRNEETPRQTAEERTAPDPERDSGHREHP